MIRRRRAGRKARRAGASNGSAVAVGPASASAGAGLDAVVEDEVAAIERWLLGSGAGLSASEAGESRVLRAVERRRVVGKIVARFDGRLERVAAAGEVRIVLTGGRIVILDALLRGAPRATLAIRLIGLAQPRTVRPARTEAGAVLGLEGRELLRAQGLHRALILLALLADADASLGGER